MSGAQARIEQKIIITGADNASDAIKKAQGSMASLGKTAVGTQRQLEAVDPSKKIRETSGDVESALKGVSDFGGTAGQSISKVGDAFGAVEAVTRLLPGPLGLAATAIGGMALGAKLLFDSFSQDKAKLSLLTDPNTRKLGENLGFSTEQTVKLQQAFNGLPAGIRPSSAAIQQVVDNANAMGGDPADALAKYFGAFPQGIEAVRALRAEIGDIGEALTPLADVAKTIGLNPQALGLVATLTDVQKLNKSLEDVRKGEADIAAAKKRIADAEAETAKGTVANRLAAMDKLAIIRESAEAEIGSLKETLELDTKLAQKRAESVAISKAGSDVIQAAQTRQQEADLRAQLTGDKQAANGIRLNALSEQRADIAEEIQRLEALQNAGKSDAITKTLQLLGLEFKRSEVATKAIKDAEAAERKAKATAGAAKAKARRDKEIAEANKVSQGRVDATIAAAKAESEAFDAMVDREQAAYAARRDAAQSASDAIRETRLVELEGLSTIQSALGKHDQAAQASAQADQIRRDAEISRIDESIAARRKEAADRSITRISEDLSGDPLAVAKEQARAADELALLEKERLAQLDAVRSQYAVKDQQRQMEAQQRERQAIADQGAALNALIQSASQGLNGFGSTGSKVGSALSAIGQGVEGVSANWGDLAKAAPSAIDAVGGVATAFVDSEKSKALILAASNAAHSVAALAAGNIPAAITHGIAAGMYGAIAGGAIGGSSGGNSAQNLGNQQGPASKGNRNTGGGNNGGGQTVIMNFTQPLATKQEVGKEVHKSLKAVGKSGYATSRGV